MPDLKYLIALNHFQKFGPVRIKKISRYFDNWENAFRSDLSELIKSGLEENIASEFVSARNGLDPDQIMENLNREQIKTIALNDEDYPRLLAEIYDPPPLLYYKGELKNGLDEYSLAIVGTRKYTGYGRQTAEKFAGQAALKKITVVSGLAYGIDTIAHNACLENNGRTIAVLGTGLDRQSIYPSANRYLAEKIIKQSGAVISEFPLGTAPLKHNFPQRNRIISGLSLGSLVVEAGEKSGALITAQCALEQNREVFAVPGSIFSPMSAGPNNLIKQGAKPVSDFDDILETLDLKNISAYIDNKKIIPASEEESLIVDNLTHEPKHVDEIIRLTKLSASVINSTLTVMEMKGLIKNLGNRQYVLAR